MQRWQIASVKAKITNAMAGGKLLAVVVSALVALPWLSLLARPEKPVDEWSFRFNNRAEAAGVRFVLDNNPTADKPILDSVLGGVGVFDFDNDGYLDIYFTNGARLPSFVKDDKRFYNRLFRNNHDGTFTDCTEHAGVAGRGYSMGVAVADFDNDGWRDLYITGFDRNTLFHNNGNGTFSDVTEKAAVKGVDVDGRKPWSTAAAWVDYDNDGFLDLFVVNYLDWSFAKNRVCGEAGKRLSCSPETYGGLANALYRNNGNGTFTDVSMSAGISGLIGKGMSAAIADYDGDGWSDIFVTNDKEPNMLLHNEGGKRFRETAVEAGTGYNQDGIAVSGMGVDFRDVDNDGRPDAVVTALAGETFLLFTNLRDGFFSERSYQTGLGLASLHMSGWTVGAYDFDNDGLKDLFSANSHASENVGQYGQRQYRQANAVFRNTRNGRFQDVSSALGKGIQLQAAHRGGAFGDLNNDGRVDAVISAIGSGAELWMNETKTGHHWISIRTVGTKSNRDGIGTVIKVTSASGLVQYNHVTTAVGYASSSDSRVHFGLYNDTRVREIELRWPSGLIQRLADVPADQVLTVTEK